MRPKDAALKNEDGGGAMNKSVNTQYPSKKIWPKRLIVYYSIAIYIYYDRKLKILENTKQNKMIKRETVWGKK